jgi:hypothetical protein
MAGEEMDILERIRIARDRAAAYERYWEAKADAGAVASLAATIHLGINAAIRATLDNILDPDREQPPMPTILDEPQRAVAPSVGARSTPAKNEQADRGALR